MARKARIGVSNSHARPGQLRHVGLTRPSSRARSDVGFHGKADTVLALAEFIS
jgi:hypothetical protein